MTQRAADKIRGPIKDLVSIYNYTSYREYLNALYEEGKKYYYRFSYRDFAEALGGVSAGTLRLIIKGFRGIMLAQAQKLGEHLKLSPRQLEYFLLMVAYDRTSNTEEKHAMYLQLSRLRMHGATARIETHQYRYLSEWYNVVIRELVKNRTLDSIDYSALAQRVQPPVTAAQARKSVEILLDLGLLERDNDGIARVSSSFLQTPPEIHSLAVKTFHNAMIHLGSDSIERVSSVERDIAAMTLYMSDQAFEKVKEILNQTKSKILDVLKEDSNATRVYQLNYQLFPVSQVEDNEKSEVVNES